MINSPDSSREEPNGTIRTDQWSISRVIAWEKVQKLTQRKGGFLTSSGILGSNSSGKWYRGLGSDSTKWRTRCSGGVWGNHFIGQLTPVCVINPKYTRTIGSNKSRSMAEVQYACWSIGDRGLVASCVFAKGRWVRTLCGYVWKFIKFEVWQLNRIPDVEEECCKVSRGDVNTRLQQRWNLRKCVKTVLRRKGLFCGYFLYNGL